MTRQIAAFALLGCALILAKPSARAEQQTATPVTPASTRDIDRDVWTVIVDTVEHDDIVRMGSTYFPDAVLVTPKSTQAITAALDGWGRDMVANKAKGTRAMVAFRFSLRQDNATTAFETGIFNYSTIDKAGGRTPGYYPFEELLVKVNGQWRILMERQFAAVTEAEWAKLPPWR